MFVNILKISYVIGSIALFWKTNDCINKEKNKLLEYKKTFEDQNKKLLDLLNKN